MAPSVRLFLMLFFTSYAEKMRMASRHIGLTSTSASSELARSDTSRHEWQDSDGIIAAEAEPDSAYHAYHAYHDAMRQLTRL